MDRQQKATQAQRTRLVGMIESGLITRQEVQTIIERYRPFDPNDPLAYWESLAPGSGAEIMKALHPFYSWRPVLKRVMPSLQEHAQKAIFWREITGVKTFKHTGEVEVWHSLRDSLRNAHFDDLEDAFRFSFQTSFRDTPSDTLHDELGNAIWHAYRDAVPRQARDNASCRSSWDSSWEAFWSSLWDALRATLFYAVSCTSDEMEKYKPLFELWRAGNFPIGFDRDGNLLVLVA